MERFIIFYADDGSVAIASGRTSVKKMVSEHYYPWDDNMIDNDASDDEVIMVYRPDRKNSFEGAYLEKA